MIELPCDERFTHVHGGHSESRKRLFCNSQKVKPHKSQKSTATKVAISCLFIFTMFLYFRRSFLFFLAETLLTLEMGSK